MKLTSRLITILGLATSLVMIEGCSKKKGFKAPFSSDEDSKSKKKKDSSKESSDAKASDEEGSEGDEDPKKRKPKKRKLTLNDLQPNVGLKNFDQIKATYAVLTGIPATHPQVIEAYNKFKSSLPVEHLISSISAAKVSASTKLAATYCDVLTLDPAFVATRTQIFPGIDFAAGPATLNSATLAQQLADRFFYTGVQSSGNTEENVQIIAKLIDDMKATNIEPEKTPAIVMGACAAVLSSADVITL